MLLTPALAISLFVPAGGKVICGKNTTEGGRFPTTNAAQRNPGEQKLSSSNRTFVRRQGGQLPLVVERISSIAIEISREGDISFALWRSKQAS